jgi:hypothetical protein
MAKQVRVVEFDRIQLRNWARPVQPPPGLSVARSMEHYLCWAMGRGWRLLAMVGLGVDFYVTWEGEDTTGSPDLWEQK